MAYPNDSEAVSVLVDSVLYLWVAAIVFFGIGDLVTTIIGLKVGNVAEVGPVVAPLIDLYGLGILGFLKLGAIGVCYVLWRWIPDPYAVGTPLGLAVLGLLVTGWNILILLVAHI